MARRTQYVATQEQEQATEHETLGLNIFTIGGRSTRPIYADLVINGKQLTMEVDTGAAVSVISEETRKSLLSDLPLRKSNAILRTYTGEQMQVMGELHTKVEYRKPNQVSGSHGGIWKRTKSSGKELAQASQIGLEADRSHEC